MKKEQIIQMACEHDLHCYGSITDNSLYAEVILGFAAAIIEATKEEDAKICDGLPAKDSDGPWFNHDMSTAAYACASAIRESKP